MSDIKKVVLAYSGGLDTSIILKWLQETYKADVVAYIADVGQGEETEPARINAEKTGACAVYVKDLKEEFARDYVMPAMKANAIYEGTYLLGTSVARPLISKAHIEILREEGADAVSHGATGKGNDQVRFELGYYALEPGVKVIAPWREWDLNSRESLVAYAEKHGIEIPPPKLSKHSMDRNTLHVSYEGDILEDPWAEPLEDMFLTTLSPMAAPDEPTYVEINFEEGIPIAVDGVAMTPHGILEHLNKLGGNNGIGRVDIVENRFVGMKSRGVYETPGGTILYVAHRGVESITMDREVMLQRDQLSPKIAQLIYNGFWFAPEFEMMMSMVDKSQENVTGTARVRLYKGNCDLVGRRAEKSLYDERITSFEDDEGAYDQTDATGFINLNSLRLRVRKNAGL